MALHPLFQDALNNMAATNHAAANEALIKSIQDALGTEKTGSALIEVARSAHRAKAFIAKIARLEALTEKDIEDASPERLESETTALSTLILEERDV